MKNNLKNKFEKSCKFTNDKTWKRKEDLFCYINFNSGKCLIVSCSTHHVSSRKACYFMYLPPVSVKTLFSPPK